MTRLLNRSIPLPELERRWRLGEPVSPWRVVLATGGGHPDVLVVWSPQEHHVLPGDWLGGLSVQALPHLAPGPSCRCEDDVPASIAATLSVSAGPVQVLVTIPTGGWQVVAGGEPEALAAAERMAAALVG